MAIISASRRTDIPAFFHEWFMYRIREGYFDSVNPFNAGQVKRVSLSHRDVEAIVFWSKNPRPLMQNLEELDRRGLNYYFHFTLNPYPHLWEPNVPTLDERVQTFRELAGRLGPQRVVWRYDPIIVSSVTPIAWHLDQFRRLALALRGKTMRVVFSFLDLYGKSRSRLSRLEKVYGITIPDATADPHKDKIRAFASGLKQIADEHGVEIFSCAEGNLLEGTGVDRASCIDGTLISSLFGIEQTLAKDKNQRPECLCATSVDMGMYNTCSFQCIYCYANVSEGIVRHNLAKHKLKGPSILDSYGNRNGSDQLSLF